MRTILFYLGFIFLFFPSPFVFAEDSPLCKDLARFSCAPGSYHDGTGEVKNEAYIQKELVNYSVKAREALAVDMTKVIADPANEYFRSVSLAALGLMNAPQCTSKDSAEISKCNQNLIEGLTALAQKDALGELGQNFSNQRLGNVIELSHVMSNAAYLKVIEDAKARLRKDLKTEAFDSKIKDEIFPQVKKLIIAKINSLNISVKDKKLMTSKVGGITFGGTDCTELAKGKNASQEKDQHLNGLLVPNAIYYNNIFKICNGLLLKSSSEFLIVQSMAHELSHSIDPCTISIGPEDFRFNYSHPGDLTKMEKEFPVPVLSCLRSKESVGAINFTTQITSGLGYGYGVGPPSTDPTKGPAKNNKQSAEGYKPGGPYLNGIAPSDTKLSFCEKDQIGESFADWLGFEVLPQYMEKNHKLTPEQYRIGYSNTFRPMCTIHEVSGQNNNDEHPPVQDRINKLLLVQPQIRRQMGCLKKLEGVVYCDANQPQQQKLAVEAVITPVNHLPGAKGTIQ